MKLGYLSESMEGYAGPMCASNHRSVARYSL